MRKQCFAEFFRCASLSILGMLGLSCYILADTYFIASWLGVNGLAALNLAIPVYNLIHGCGLMLGMGGGVQYTGALSRNAPHRGNCIFTHTLMLWAVLSLLFMLTGLFFSEQIALLLGADDATLDMSRTYLRMLLLCSPAFLLNDCILSFVRNDGAPQLAMAGMVTGSLSNILLDYVFIFLLEWGMFGAVFATCLAPVISLCIMSVFFVRKRNRFRPVKIHPDLRLTGNLLAMGLPSLVTEFSSGIVIIVFNSLMLQFAGNTGVAAYGVIANISLVVVAVFTGMAQGIQPLLSRDFACQAHRRLVLTMRYSLLSILALSAILYSVIFFGASWIAGIFNSQGDALLQACAVQGLRLYFTGMLFAGCNILLCVYFVSVSRPKEGNLLSLLRGFILILPLAFLLSEWGRITGLWLAFPVTELITAAVAGILVWASRRIRHSP